MYLRELQLGERQERLLNAHLDNPDASVDVYSTQSNLAKSAFHSHRNALAEVLANHLNGWHVEEQNPVAQQAPIYGSAPAAPDFVIGREYDLHLIKGLIGITNAASPSSSVRPLTVLWGWPGVAKPPSPLSLHMIPISGGSSPTVSYGSPSASLPMCSRS